MIELYNENFILTILFINERVRKMLETLILLSVLAFVYLYFGFNACLIILASIVFFFIFGLILAILSKIVFYFTGLIARSDSAIPYLSLIFLILLGIWTEIELFIWISIFAGLLLTIQLVFKISVDDKEYYEENKTKSQNHVSSSKLSVLEKIAIFLGLAWLFSDKDKAEDYSHSHNSDNESEDEENNTEDYNSEENTNSDNTSENLENDSVDSCDDTFESSD